MIVLTTFAFEITQNKLAKMMHCHESKITRIKNGEEGPPLGIKEIFTNVFDPTNPESVVKSCENAGYYLDVLKTVIESNFKGIFEAMTDCWNEKEYKKFVLTLLSRARKGAYTGKALQPSTDCGKNPVSSDVNIDEDCRNRHEKASLSETPSEQMSKIFEQAVANYSIASYVCKMPDYLSGEPFCAGEIFAFIDMIQENVIVKFLNQQNEITYKNISEFNRALKAYSMFLCMIRSSISGTYGFMLKAGRSNDEIISLIESDDGKIKNNLDKKISMKGDGINEPSISKLEEELTQLEFIHSILLAHKQLCEIFGEMYPGKTVLVF